MHTSILRRVGGSVMLAIPPALLDVMEVTVGSTVGVAVEDGNLIVEPQRRPSYSLDELIAQCDPDAPLDDETRAWIGGAPAGRELL